MQIPWGCQKKCLLCRQSAICNFVNKVEISLYSKNYCGAILGGFADSWFATLFVA